MKEFWDERYASNETVYGTTPNQFFKEQLDKLAPGKLLLPCEGEGRNAIYGAKNGWEVTAFDFSSVAVEKAKGHAAKEGLSIEYQCMALEDFRAEEKKYDCIAIIYVHQQPLTMQLFFDHLISSLKPSGTLLLEGFSKNQIFHASGGPKDINMLYCLEQLKTDFSKLRIQSLEEIETVLEEGKFHSGKAALIRLIATSL